MIGLRIVFLYLSLFKLLQTMMLKKFDFTTRLTALGILIFVIAQIYFGFSELAISWDSFGYYLYLPYSFIYNDLSFSDLSHVTGIAEHYESTDTLYQLTHVANGNHVIKYPVGMAILFSPFFFIGHFIAYLFGYPMDGFSAPYDTMVSIGNLVYVVIGIIYLRKVLLNFFTSKVTIIALIGVVIGTNFLYMATTGAGSSHVPLFALHAVALYLTIKWHEAPSVKNSFKFGAVIGLMIIARPTEILFLLIPLFWGVTSVKVFFQKYYELITKRTLSLFVFSLVIVLIGFIQLFYWKAITGEWLFYSYDNAGEGFDFVHPYLKEFLFSYRKGWYLYTPIMLIATIGLLFTVLKKYKLGISLVLFFGLNVWILSSWSCWWYAGSYSQRSMVQSYPEMAIALGAILTFAMERLWLKRITLTVVTLLIALNLFQTWQFHKRIINGSRMTSEYYWTVFGKTSVPEGAENLLMINRPSVQKTTPEDISKYKNVKNVFFKKSVSFTEDQEFVDFERFEYSKLTEKDHGWIKLSGKSSVIKRGGDEEYLMVTCFTHKDDKYSYVTWSPAEMPSYSVDSVSNCFEFWYLTPEVRSTEDKFLFEIWNRAKSNVKIEDLRLEIFTKK
jgi:hypothetical protein